MGIIDTLLAGVAGTFGVIFISGLVWNFLDAEAGQRIWWRILIVFVIVLGIQALGNNLDAENAEQAEEIRTEEYEAAYDEGYKAGIIRVKEEFGGDIEDLLFCIPAPEDVASEAYTFETVAGKLQNLTEEISSLINRLDAFGAY